MSLYRREESPSGRLSAIFRFFAVISVIALIASFTGYQIFRFVNRTKVESLFRQKDTFSILISAESSSAKGRQIRFLTVATVNVANKRIGFLSFFPQTKMVAGQPSLQEILVKDSEKEVRKTLGKYAGTDISYYLSAKFEDVRKLIDLIEGVPYFLWSPDILKGENLPVGEFVLDGSLLDKLVNIPEQNEYSPAFQLFRNYSLLLNMWQVRKDKWEILRKEKVFAQAVAGLNTNLNPGDLYYMADTFFGEKGWLLNFIEAPVKRVKDSFILDEDAMSLYLKNFRKTLTQPENPWAAEPPKMEIKNGTEVPNLARALRGKLSRKGVQVLEFTNADRNDYNNSVLLNTSGQPFYLESAASILGVTRVYHAVNRSLFTDLVLVLGGDYRNLKLDDKVK
jgi:hypothetical protein